ncbi:MAG: cyclic nucleotide-binding domain-containing protein [Myxococcota bacterium]|nr:cyclic nucleotide-binding domain-containing protein [Myxococcota bacterium]
MAERTIIEIMSDRLKDARAIDGKISRRIPRTKRFFSILTGLGIFLVTTATLSNIENEFYDQALHFSGYFVLSVLCTFSLRLQYMLYTIFGLMGIAVISEYLNPIPEHTLKAGNVWSNVLGILAGLLVGALLNVLLMHLKNEMRVLLSEKRTHDYRKNEKIFSQGEPSRYIYVVVEGEVLIYRKEDKERVPIDVVKPGEVFGEMGVILSKDRYAAARAKTDCSLFRVSKKELLYSHEGNTHPAILVTKTLARRLKESNETIRQLRQKIND